MELADYVEKICGRRPAVLDGQSNTVPERAVWVGFQSVLKSLCPKTDFEFRHPEETLIVVGEKDAAVAVKVKENWASLERLIAKNAPAINAGPVRSSTPRMAGLHPDSPPKKVKPARAIELDLK